MDLWREAQRQLPGKHLNLRVQARGLLQSARAVLASAPPRFNLVGHSLGGIISMAAATIQPDRVASLVLISTNGRAPTGQQMTGWDELEHDVAAGRFPSMTQVRLWNALVHPSRTGESALLSRVVAMADATGPDAFLDQLATQRTRWDLRPALGQYGGPALVIHPEDDALCTADMHSEIATALPRGKLMTLPGAGHLAPLEDPGRFTQLLRDFEPLHLPAPCRRQTVDSP
ncbi:alpha/beta fold hydrolase [Paenarthrobacter sp. AMU7]|uniref:Alpha/beta fold hydrolase n=1 Tax=Paenarthrobacter sp. AMU7 TaxID=3162492 RepID=A0AB39YNP6_9MICC